VHVIREGLEVVASLHEASQSWERPYDLDACVERWNSDVAFSLGRVRAPNDCFVFYEELTARPVATLRRLLEQLDLGWEPEILERYSRTSERLVTRDEAWKQGTGRVIRRSRTSDRSLDADARDRVTRSLHQDLYRQLFERAGPRSSEAGDPA
jgi:hypothetical protein